MKRPGARGEKCAHGRVINISGVALRPGTNTYHSIVYPAPPLPPNDFKPENSAPARVGIKLHGETFHSSMTRLFPASAMNEALLIIRS